MAQQNRKNLYGFRGWDYIRLLANCNARKLDIILNSERGQWNEDKIFDGWEDGILAVTDKEVHAPYISWYYDGRGYNSNDGVELFWNVDLPIELKCSAFPYDNLESVKRIGIVPSNADLAIFYSTSTGRLGINRRTSTARFGWWLYWIDENNIYHSGTFDQFTADSGTKWGHDGTYAWGVNSYELSHDPVYDSNIKIGSTVKMFPNEDACLKWIYEADDSEQIAPSGEAEAPAPDRQTTLYLKCDVMQRSNDPTATPEKIKSVSIEFVVQYKTNGGEPIGTGNPRTGVVGIVTNTLDTQLFNIWYKQPNDTAKRCKVYKMYVDTGNGRHEVDPSTWNFTSADRLGIYKTEVYKDNNIFYGNIRTNMLIFANEAAAEGYINKTYDPTTGKLPAPILDGDRTYSPDLPTGDKLTYNGIQTMPTGGLSECWLLDAAGLEQLASIFKTGLTIEENEEFGFFETTLLSTVRGLSMYNSPIDMIVDMFWIPIDISDYCNLGSETQFTVNGEEYAGEYGLSSAYSWIKQRQDDSLNMTGRIGNAIGESFAVKTQQDPTNE